MSYNLQIYLRNRLLLSRFMKGFKKGKEKGQELTLPAPVYLLRLFFLSQFLYERCEQIDGDRKDGGGVPLGGNFG